MPQTKAKAKPPIRKPRLQPLTKFERIINNRAVGRAYLIGSVGVLILTTCLWATLGARLHNDNADQLVDSYLFENAQTAHGASLPGQHTFLFKWPIFWLQHIFGYSQNGFMVLTVFVVLLTVGALAYLLWRIERRPFIFGLLCLALSSVLLLIPPVPYPGALLPVNMAMLTTRNLEYILYLLGLILIAGVGRIRSVRFIAASVCFGLLFASDRLFGTLSFGGALLALGVYVLARRQELKRLAWYWLLATIVGLVLAAVLLSLLNMLNIVHIVGQSTTTPYGLVPSAHAFILGCIYVVSAMFTNIGANPASSATTLAAIPHSAKNELLGLSSVAYAVNLTLLCIGIWCCFQIIRSTVVSAKVKAKKKQKPTRLGIRLATMLVFTTAAAVASYVITNHYYLVDSRYIAIELFTIFIATAVYCRSVIFRPKLVLLASSIVLLAILSGSYAAVHTSTANTQALAPARDRNSLIVAALSGHPTEIVVGNYWRVLPLKLASSSRQTVLPLASCTTPRSVLTSDAWQPDLKKHNFAYILSLDSGDKDFKDCTLQRVTAAYGRPNANIIIAGTNENPKEIILFYDKAVQSGTPPVDDRVRTASSGFVNPVQPKKLKHAQCKGHRTILQIVAHEDDDLLFMNPDLSYAIQDGDCIRTVYLTAGDAGAGKFYWLGREQGSEAAYEVLTSNQDLWFEETIKFANHEFATVASPSSSSKYSLIFMHLPDGKSDGQGFGPSNFESLAKLEAGSIGTINTVDKQSTYTRANLLAAVTTLIDVYRPDEVRTQLPYSANMSFVDHSDHTAVGRLAAEAFRSYQTAHPAAAIAYYIGYPVHAFEPNVSDGDLSLKEEAFFAYSRFDGATCGSFESCMYGGVYGAYLTRQYRIDVLAE